MKFTMKKTILILALTLLTMSASAQSDSLEIQKIRNIENNLSKFYQKNRFSQVFTVAGAVCVLASFAEKTAEKKKTLLYVGSGLGLVGYVIYLDSFNELNFKKVQSVKRKPKPVIDPWY